MTLKNKNICSIRLSLTLALMTLMPLMGMMMLMTVVTMMLTQNWIFNESFLQQLSDSASRPSDGRGWKGEEDQVSSMIVMLIMIITAMMMVMVMVMISFLQKDKDKVNRCLARYSPRATTSN